MSVTRRTFAKATAAVALSTAASRAVGANDRLRVAFIGVANRGMQLVSAFLENKDCQIVAVCDVDEQTREKAKTRLAGEPDSTGDFRKVLDRKDVDAVVIATPDHWHAIQTIWACHAGKDVYVEKPLSITLHEGKKMVEHARATRRVVQVGLHRRSSKLYAAAARLIQEDKLGKVTVGRCYQLSNMYPAGIGKAPAGDPPAGLDWDLWLGPRPAQPFQATIAPYKFRWWSPFSSQIANNGTHFIDSICWMTGEKAPLRIAALGGRFAVDDDRTIPDTAEFVFELPGGRLLIFGHYEACGNPAIAEPGYCELRGTQGSAFLSDSVVKIIPEKGGQFQDHRPRLEPTELKASDVQTDKRGVANLSLTAQHARNFLDCIRSRQTPACDVEVGHRSTSFALLGNIALATRATLEWDAAAEDFVGNPQASALRHYEYRTPWTLEP